MISREDLNAFLWFCYLPRLSYRFLRPITDDQSYCIVMKERLSRTDEGSLVTEGARVLRQAFERDLRSADGLQVVPLSGGLDSRLILAHLLEAGFRDQIVAVTYGTPGALDFEIPKEVARCARVRHETIDLTNVPLTREDLRYAYLCGASWTYLISSYYNHMIKRLFGDDATYWSGFLGDPLAGSHYAHGYDSMSWEDAKKLFLRVNRWCQEGHRPLHECGFPIDSLLPREPPICDRRLLSYPEQLDFGIRQSAWIHKNVVGSFQTVRTPYADPDWTRFILLAPSYLRIGCKLYHRIMLQRFPSLFRVRTKSVPSRYLDDSPFAKHSRRIRGLGDRVAGLLGGRPPSSRCRETVGPNYIDIAGAYRRREDFRALAEESMDRLERRRILEWIDFRSLWDCHVRGQDDLSREIDVVISLEMNLTIEETA